MSDAAVKRSAAREQVWQGESRKKNTGNGRGLRRRRSSKRFKEEN